jgi:hypothetical protein
MYPNTTNLFSEVFSAFKKASILLKMHLKSLAIFEKASISLKKSTKRIKIFKKASHF